MLISCPSHFLVSTILVLLPILGETEEDRDFLRETIHSGYSGSYRMAAMELEDYLDEFPESVQAIEGLVMVERARGNYQEALKWANSWFSRAPESEGLQIAMAQLQADLGQYEASEEHLRLAEDRDPTGLRPRAELACLLFQTGRRQEARALAQESVDLHSVGSLDGEGLVQLSRFYELLGDLDRAAQAAVLADEKLNGRTGSNYRLERHEALMILGRIYGKTRLGSGSRDRGSGNRALDCYRDGLKINPNLGAALVGLARTRFYAANFQAAHQNLDKALLVNPHQMDALALKAHLLTLTRQYDKAVPLIDRGLEINPRNKALWAQRGVIRLLDGDVQAFNEAMAEALATDPTFGEGYYQAGEILIYHFRFEEAEEMLNKCLELDPDFHEAYIMLARALANLGREDAAREALLTSLQLDPFAYPWRENMLRVLGELDTYVKSDGDLFQLRLEVEEAAVIRRYINRWGQESLQLLGEKYGFTPKEPLLMEVFPDNQDFAVRTIGFTGLGALGACFGRVVTLLSPRSEPFRGSFNWACTLHHELCHVVTLQLSRSRIPRWLTEGISVYEEGVRKATWKRNMTFELFNSYHNDSLFDLDNFDRGFMSGRVLFAYYQAGLTVQFIVERFGLETLREMILAYGKDLNTRGVLKKALDLDVTAFTQAFKDWLWNQKLFEICCRPFYGSEKHQELVTAAKKKPKNRERQLAAAWACFRNGKAIDALYFLNRIPASGPRDGQVALLRGAMAYHKGEHEKAAEFYQQALGADLDDFYALRNLGLMAMEKGDRAEAINYFIRAKAAFPAYNGPGSPRRFLLEIYLDLERKDEAVQEMEGLLREGVVDLTLISGLGAHYAERNEPKKAVFYYTEAIQIDPFQRGLHVSLAEQLRALSLHGQALEEIDAALQVKSDSEATSQSLFPSGLVRDENKVMADIYAEKGAVLLELDRNEEALQAIEKALRLKPAHKKALNLKKKSSGQDPEEGLLDKGK